ncbi:MAG: hypothetical protein U0176_21415 [Bacteroidia bacterium]
MSNLSKFLLLGTLLAVGGASSRETIHLRSDIRTESATPVEKTKYLRENNVVITPLIDGNTVYGHEIELKRRSGRVRAKYFATGAVYSKYQEWQPYNDVVMVCSGAFTSDYKTPMGLTIENGVLVNKLIDTKMDGLVIVYPNGGIAVSNLEDGNLRYGTPETVANLRSYKDLNAFINWAEREQATVFQTQLLAYDNELKLDMDKARTGQAERRILVIAKNPLGEVLHIVYDITTSEHLGDVAPTLLRYAKMERGLQVVAMLNLDTGAENIMEVYNDYGYKLPDPTGSVPIANAINLIAWSYTAN